LPSAIADPARAEDELTFVLAVWGTWHVDAFLTLCLPSLLSANNLPALLESRRARFVVFTTEHDRNVMQASPVWEQFAKLIDVTFETLTAAEIKEPVQTQQMVWWRAIDLTTRNRGFLFFIPPDVVWSDGSMRTIARALAAGKRIIIVPWTVRVTAETFVPAIKEFFATQELMQGIGSRELVRMTLQHLHPLMSAYRIGSTFFPHHPEMFLMPIPHQGLLLRLTASIPTIFKPADIALTPNKLVARQCSDEELYMPTDSDELFVVSLAPFVKEFHFYNRPRRADPITVGRWWDYYSSGSNDFLARTNYRIHYSELDPAAWRKAEQRVDLFLRRAVIAREGLLVWTTIRQYSHLRIATRILALALGTGLLARVVCGHGKRVIVVPEDSAFAAAGMDLDALLTHAARHELTRSMRQHLAVISDETPFFKAEDFTLILTSDAGAPMSVSRLEGGLMVNGHRIRDEPITVGEHVLLITDAVLMPWAAGMSPRASSRSASKGLQETGPSGRRSGA
jgi:hypothetical protein